MKFKSHRWGVLKTFQVPCDVVRENQLILESNEISVLFSLLHVAKGRKNIDHTPALKMSNETLMERTGYSKNVVTSAVRGLEEKKFIQCTRGVRKKREEFAVNEYIVLNPRTAEPLTAFPGAMLFFSNKVPYLTVPTCIVAEGKAHWCLANLSGSEVSVYTCLLWQANEQRRNRFKTSDTNLRKLSGLAHATLNKALDTLESKHLICRHGQEFELCDPYTGEPLAPLSENTRDNPANYFVTADDGVSRRLDMNSWTEQEAERLLEKCLPDHYLDFKRRGDGEIMLRCPFHDDENASCSVSLRKRCFRCFGCNRSGTLNQFVRECRSLSVAESIEEIARVVGRKIKFREPMSKAEETYEYRDAKGKLVKQVLRYPGKKFSQRCPGNGGWIYDVSRVKPLLYNLQELQYANVALICEGEKDADRVHRFGLYGVDRGNVVATTSGGADSWTDVLANDLAEKRVVILRDSDAAGERYANQIKKSLQKRGIEHRVISFGDAGVNDVSDFLNAGGTPEGIVQRVGFDWLSVADPALETPHSVLVTEV